MHISVITPVGSVYNQDYFADSQAIRQNDIPVEWIGVLDGWSPLEEWHLDIFDKMLASPVKLGPGAARNAALRTATGDWVYALDYDDIPVPNGLSNMVRKAEEKGKVWGAAYSYDVLTGGEPFAPPAKAGPWEDDIIPLDEFWRSYEEDGFFPFLCAGNIVARTEILRGLGGWSEKFSFRGEDIPLFILLSQQHEGAYLDEMVHLYRKHGLSITAKSQDEAYETELMAYIEHLRSTGGPVL